jgi:Na+-transporting methylmalonyl-CoA/oxaloacetate decarboxylase gamma subunit
MIKKIIFLAVILSLSLTVLPAHAIPGYTPHQGDSFSYYEIINLTNGTGTYYGYTEHETVNGIERMNQAFGNGTVVANYTYTWNWSNSSGSTNSGKSAGNFTWSSTSFQYIKGTDNQTGYVKPLYVWFYMDNTTQPGGTFHLLNTPMTVTSTSYSYSLASQNKYVKSIRAQGTGGYPRNDVYGQFNAAYTYTTYSDPSTGYIVGYDYVEQDTSSAASFTWTDTFYVTTTSYPLTAGAGPSFLQQYLGLIVGLAVVFIFIGIIVVVIVAVSRKRRSLPKHTYPQVPIAPPQIDLTPKQQPPVQQVVIKEVVKVKCKYCGALIDSTVQACPFCGAPRT